MTKLNIEKIESLVRDYVEANYKPHYIDEKGNTFSNMESLSLSIEKVRANTNLFWERREGRESFIPTSPEEGYPYTLPQGGYVCLVAFKNATDEGRKNLPTFWRKGEALLFVNKRGEVKELSYEWDTDDSYRLYSDCLAVYMARPYCGKYAEDWEEVC